jgi:hypothetical protein
LPVALGVNRSVATVVDKVNDLEYMTALGLVVWGNQMTKEVSGKGPLANLPFQKMFDKVRGLFSSLRP